jgi:glycosyltransferase involved in cell wall biosynthesis
MGSKILYDGMNISLPTGTGIATYMRSLAGTAEDLGYEVSVAYALPCPVPDDPMLREVKLFEGRASSSRGRLGKARDWCRARLGSYRTQALHPIPLSAVEIGPVQDRLPAHSEVLVGERIFERGRHHFAAWGGFSELQSPAPPDIAHFTFAAPLTVKGAVNLYTIHDLVPLRLPYTTLDDKHLFLKLHREIARTADHIVTVSEASRRDIIRWLELPETRVTNTYQSVAIPERLRTKSLDDVAKEIGGLFGLELGRYFLFYGAIEPKKNVSRLLEAFLSSGVNIPLVIVSSSGWQNDRELGIIGNKLYQGTGTGGSNAGVRLKSISYAPYEVLVSLIRGARAVTFPSLYEGFGLPVLEAMLLGTPVLTSNAASLPEVAGDAALLVDPTDVPAIRSGIVALASDGDLCRELASRGYVQADKFSPERYRERVSALYGSLGCPVPNPGPSAHA